MADNNHTRYIFRIKTGETADGPVFDAWVRKFSHDAQAELFAKRLSEENGNCYVGITRGDATWSVWSGYLPAR